MSGAAALMLGAGSSPFALPTAAADASAGVNATATINMNSDGSFTCVGGTLGTTQSGNWIIPTSFAPGAYTIRLHLDSGTSPTGSAQDTDLALSSNRSWTVTRTTIGTNNATTTLTLKDGGGNTVKSQQATFNATRGS